MPVAQKTLVALPGNITGNIDNNHVLSIGFTAPDWFTESWFTEEIIDYGGTLSMQVSLTDLTGNQLNQHLFDLISPINTQGTPGIAAPGTPLEFTQALIEPISTNYEMTVIWMITNYETDWSAPIEIGEAQVQAITGLQLRNLGGSSQLIVAEWIYQYPNIEPKPEVILEVKTTTQSVWASTDPIPNANSYTLQETLFPSTRQIGPLPQLITERGPVNLQARIRIVGQTDWIEADAPLSITLNPFFWATIQPLERYGLNIGKLTIHYLARPDASIVVTLHVQGQSITLWAATPPGYNGGFSLVNDWLSKIPTHLRNNQPHEITLRLAETIAGQTRHYDSEPIIWTLLAPNAIPAPQMKTAYWDGPHRILVILDDPITAEETINAELHNVHGDTLALAGTINLQQVEITGLDADQLPDLLWITAQKTHPNSGISSLISEIDVDPYLKRLQAPSCNVELLRQGNGQEIEDKIRVTWTPGHLVQLLLLTLKNDEINKTIILDYADSTESARIIRNLRQYLSPGEGYHSIKIGVRYYADRKSVGIIQASDRINIRKRPLVTDPSPDENTAPRISQSALQDLVQTEIRNQYPALPIEMRNILVIQAMYEFIQRLKSIVRYGGKAHIDDAGTFYAAWSKERAINESTGKIETRYKERSPEFTPSIGFIAGVKNGTLMTDAEAEAAAEAEEEAE